MTHRSFCFTINNYNMDDEINIGEWQCRYVIGGYEEGICGTKHIQGYVEFDKPKKIGGLKKLHKTAHWEARRGTRVQAREYCMKHGEYFEYGDWNLGGQGTRNDLKNTVTMLQNGTRATEIILDDPEMASKHLKWLEKAQEIIDRNNTREFRNVTTEVLIGEAGIGKTRYVFEQNKKKNVFTVNPEDNFPFDGYDGEDVILIDDFYGNIKYSHILKILDGHQLRINIKGGHRYAKWTKVYITSNNEPETWYNFGMTEALERRLTKVTSYRKISNEVAR